MKRRFYLLCGLLFLCGSIALAQTVSVSGTITDADGGTGLPGVTILEQGSTNGAVSDLDGNYYLTVNLGATLQFSFTGFEKQLIPLNSRTVINVVLAESSTILNEVVVTAFGMERQK